MIFARRTIDGIRPIKVVTRCGKNRFKYLIIANELGSLGRLNRCTFALKVVVFISNTIADETSYIYYFNPNIKFFRRTTILSNSKSTSFR